MDRVCPQLADPNAVEPQSVEPSAGEAKKRLVVAKAGNPLLQGTNRLWRCHHITGQPQETLRCEASQSFLLSSSLL